MSDPSVRGSSPARLVLVAAAVVAALVLQTTVFPHLAWRGVVPDLVLLVVVAAGLARGSHHAMVLGFFAGALLDLAPPADHVAGRWALALMLVGYVAGQVRREAAPSVGVCLATVAACSFLGSSVFALSGLVLQDSAASIPDQLGVVFVAVVWDVLFAALLAALVIAPVRRVRHRTQTDRLARR
ncbi:rod shape-determining protein MreD [Nocardioides sp.]|uniref:rod shape-determining protein MreD n=1 Tax=Nocardioides sp. TaxID=35761 RepID=UPI00263787C7|nr:rod shape-determining protein MreD [Nocardioides sp.]